MERRAAAIVEESGHGNAQFRVPGQAPRQFQRAVIFFRFIPFGLWLTALFSGIRVSFFTLFGMRFRRVDPRAIVLPLISGHKAGISLKLSAGASSIEISPAGVVIKGLPMVMIN